jgi:hypothetical protein
MLGWDRGGGGGGGLGLGVRGIANKKASTVALCTKYRTYYSIYTFRSRYRIYPKREPAWIF